MRSAQKAISVITLFSLLLSTNYSVCLGAILPSALSPLSIIQEAVSLPDAKVGVAYEYQFQSEGGLVPLTWRVTQGELPSGLILETNGKLHGKLSPSSTRSFRLFDRSVRLIKCAAEIHSAVSADSSSCAVTNCGGRAEIADCDKGQWQSAAASRQQ